MMLLKALVDARRNANSGILVSTVAQLHETCALLASATDAPFRAMHNAALLDAATHITRAVGLLAGIVVKTAHPGESREDIEAVQSALEELTGIGDQAEIDAISLTAGGTIETPGDAECPAPTAVQRLVSILRPAVPEGR